MYCNSWTNQMLRSVSIIESDHRNQPATPDPKTQMQFHISLSRNLKIWKLILGPYEEKAHPQEFQIRVQSLQW